MARFAKALVCPWYCGGWHGWGGGDGVTVVGIGRGISGCSGNGGIVNDVWSKIVGGEDSHCSGGVGMVVPVDGCDCLGRWKELRLKATGEPRLA